VVKADGTDAKDIAIHFLDMTNQRFTPAIMSKTVVQAKRLLEAGYTKDEIIASIDWVVGSTSVQMYSLGYINTMINKILVNIKEEQEQRELKKRMKTSKEEMDKYQKELIAKEGDTKKNDQSRERNKAKINRFGDATRFGEKHSFDMLKESREDD
jgi:hypothetical protein